MLVPQKLRQRHLVILSPGASRAVSALRISKLTFVRMISQLFGTYLATEVMHLICTLISRFGQMEITKTDEARYHDDNEAGSPVNAVGNMSYSIPSRVLMQLVTACYGQLSVRILDLVLYFPGSSDATGHSRGLCKRVESKELIYYVLYFVYEVQPTRTRGVMRGLWCYPSNKLTPGQKHMHSALHCLADTLIPFISLARSFHSCAAQTLGLHFALQKKSSKRH